MVRALSKECLERLTLALRFRNVHDDITHRMEGFGAQRLGEEIGFILQRVHVRHLDAHLLDHLSHEEMAPKDVLRLGVVFRVVSQVAGTRVVDAHLDGLAI